MIYNTFEPNSESGAFVKCFWTLDAADDIHLEKQRIVPDGCMEMIFHYGDLYKQYTGETDYIIQPRCFVFGQITNPLEIAPTGRTGIFAVRFHPDGFAPFATIPLTEMENRAVPLEELFGKDGLQLEQDILNAATVEERIQLATAFLMSRCINLQYVNSISKLGVEIMLQTDEQVNMGDLASQLNINRRQLERNFAVVIGLSPKQLSKMIRLQHTLQLIKENQVTNLTAVAIDSNYYDQAHFIKDFKEFTGMSPKKFYANNLKMTLLFAAAK